MSDPLSAIERAVRGLLADGRRPVVLIDGGAGSGKTTLAQRLATGWPSAEGVQLVSLDDLYPGWDGLASAAAQVPSLITGTGYQSWDWASGASGPWRDLDPTRALIVEGCGAISPASAALAGLTIWVDLDPAERRRRAIARDGDSFATHWDAWAAQEAEHWLLDGPRELADLVVGG